MVDRLAKMEFANPTCADCPAERPRWASFLLNNPKDEDNVKVEGYLSVLVCDDCAIRHHNVLGEKRCFIKCLECLHEWTHKEADIVLKSGNSLVNTVYEAHLEKDDFDKSVVDDSSEAEEDRRSKFIKNKYKKAKFRNQDKLHSTLDNLQNPPPIQRVSTWSTATTEKAGHRNLTITNSKRSSLLSRLVHHNGSVCSHPRVSRATKLLTLQKSSCQSDTPPQRPTRCQSQGSASDMPSVSSLTWSEGRSVANSNSQYSSSQFSCETWWDK